MENIKRNELIKVEKWVMENDKVYLVTKTGKKYRYVGRHNFQYMRERFPKDTFLSVRSSSAGILSDDQISWLS